MESASAILFCEPEAGGLRVAALTVLDRLVVTAHRAGCRSITIVCDGEMPPIPRARALGIAPVIARKAPKFSGQTLVASTNVLVSVSDLKRLLAEGGRLVTRERKLLPIGVLKKLEGTLAKSLGRERRVMAEGVAMRVADNFSARAAEVELWDTMGSSTDGLVDQYFNRPAGRILSKVLIHTPVSPNQVSVFATLLGVYAAWWFTQVEPGNHMGAIVGALLLQLSAAVDCVDGDLARVQYKESRLGKWLDLAGDQVVHVALFVGIAVGLSRAHPEVPAGALGVSAAVGVLIAFGVVLRGILHPEARGNSRVQRLIDATTNRDFSVLIIVLAFADRLDWFIWAAAVGVHGFWMLALGLQLYGRKTSAKEEAV